MAREDLGPTGGAADEKLSFSLLRLVCFQFTSALDVIPLGIPPKCTLGDSASASVPNSLSPVL